MKNVNDFFGEKSFYDDCISLKGFIVLLPSSHHGALYHRPPQPLILFSSLMIRSAFLHGRGDDFVSPPPQEVQI